MHRFRPLLIVLSLVLASCSTTEKVIGVVPEAISNWSIVHKPTIQQGTVLTQEALDELMPGMSRDEVRFLMGSPSLVDTFHQERWDYLYTLDAPRKPQRAEKLSVYFRNDFVERIEGAYNADELVGDNNERVIVSVPDYQGEGIFKRAFNRVGIGTRD